jgi:hypothetical protein
MRDESTDIGGKSFVVRCGWKKGFEDCTYEEPMVGPSNTRPHAI